MAEIMTHRLFEQLLVEFETKQGYRPSRAVMAPHHASEIMFSLRQDGLLEPDGQIPDEVEVLEVHGIPCEIRDNLTHFHFE